MDIETVITNTRKAVDRLAIADEKTRDAHPGACHRLVLEALSGARSSPVSFGFQQISAERASGFFRSGAVAASHHQFDDIIEEPLPGAPIIIEGPTHQYPGELHCACVMAGDDGRFIIVDTLLTGRYVIVHSSEEVLSWARDTFDLSTTQFCEVDVSHRGA